MVPKTKRSGRQLPESEVGSPTPDRSVDELDSEVGSPTPVDPIPMAIAVDRLLDRPLAGAWQLYLHFRSQPGSYKQAFLAWGAEFDSIGGFWSHFNALSPPSATFTPPNQLGVQGQQIKAFSIFRGGVEPTWEDPVNAVGGEIFCRCHLETDVLDEMWLTLVLACVGDRLPGVVGVRVVDNSFRGAPTQSKIELWYPEDTDPTDFGSMITGVLQEELTKKDLPTFDHHSHVDKSRMERKFMSSLKMSKEGRSAPRKRNQ